VEEAATDRTGTILVVEDERALRTLVARVLRSRGHTALTAETAAEALEIARTHEGPLDLMLTDLVLPDFTGRDLADRVREVRPEVRILLMSGYVEDLVPRDAAPCPFPLLPKPFTPRELAARVREALDGPPGA